MTGAEKIKGKILEEAKAEAEKIMAGAKKEVERIHKRSEKECQDYSQEKKRDLERNVRLFESKTLAQERLKVKRQFLKERETIITELLGAAAEGIDHSSKAYSACMKMMVAQNLKSLTGKVKVSCNAGDRALVKRLIKGRVTIAVADVAGGLIFEDSSGKRIDETLGIRTERLMDLIRQMAVETLGGQ
ncbi:MAG: V-type ATP synthase subunit E family protein [archaeon]